MSDATIWVDIPAVDRARMQALLVSSWPAAAQRHGLKPESYSLMVMNMGGVWWASKGLPREEDTPAMEQALADVAGAFSSAGYYVEYEPSLGQWRFLPTTHPAVPKGSRTDDEG